MKFFISIVLFSISSVVIASDSHSGSHSHAIEHDHGRGEYVQSAVGMPTKPEQATKTVNVELLDTMRFKFSEEVKIKNSDVVKFVVTNTGRLPHEFSIGNQQEQDAHRQMMRNMPTMHHEDSNTVLLKPNETKEITWHFKGSEDVVFACNIPGHYEAGMHSTVKITTDHLQ